MDDLDLRDLWVETAPPRPADVDGNGRKVPTEVGAASEAPEAWPS
jgi:hypothetical protein